MSSFLEDFRTIKPEIDDLLVFCSKSNCSDLFIKVGEPPQAYRYGIMYQAVNIIDDIAWYKFSEKAITSELNTRYVREKMVDFSYEVKGYRYRVNCSYSRGKNIATFRMISTRLPSFETLHLDKSVVGLFEKAFSMKQGITLLVGATGSGKTSTLAACINSFSSGYSTRKELPLKDGHLITLEDPIEYIFPTLSATRIIQKELSKDFMSFELGIKSALREHPTHILVGETRDKPTIRALVEASRTGHACISTFHTSSVSDTIARLHSYLVGENKDILFDLISNLNFINCQKLIKGRKGYTLCYQYMFFTEYVKKVLVNAIYKGNNVGRTIDALMQSEKMLNAGLCSDWKKNQ